MARGLLVVALLALAIGVLGIRALDSYQRSQARVKRSFVATTKVREGKFEAYVEEVGGLEAETSVPILSQASGQALYVIPNGTVVKKGDLLLQLDEPRIRRELEQAQIAYTNVEKELSNSKRDREADVESAKIQLKQAETALEQFRRDRKASLDEAKAQNAFDKVDLDRARTRLERTKRWAAEGLVTKREVELAESDIKAKEFALERSSKDLQLSEAKAKSDELDKQAAITRANSDLRRQENQRDDELRTGQVKLETRGKALKDAENAFKKAAILSPADGIVVLDTEWGRHHRRSLEPGDNIWAGRRVAQLPDLSKMRVRLALGQESTAGIRSGQPALISFDALPGKTYRGEVTEISSTASEASSSGGWMPSGERTFAVLVALQKSDPEHLKPGMRAQVRIISEHQKRVLSVPVECVFDREGRRIVYVRRNGKFVATPIRLGGANERYVVVTKGLRAGETIALRDMGEASPAGKTRPKQGSGASPAGPTAL